MSQQLRMVIVSRKESGAGFGLTGLPMVTVDHGAAGGERVRELLARPDTGVVLVEDGIYDHLPDDVRRRVGRSALPMVVPFPGPSWARTPGDADAYILDLLRQVIGYRVRLK
jgi:vacuolar-type H+-ATPase subunit F/Vma7